MGFFEYLVTSDARRALVRLLWRDRGEGSVSALARQAGISFAATHGELAAMLSAGLVCVERVGAGTRYRANGDHPYAEVMRQLAASTEQMFVPEHADAVRRELHAFGAPLTVTSGSSSTRAFETVVVDGLALAHHDASVARVLPVLLWRRRDEVDWDVLVREATRRNERQALGLFLELAGQLGGDPRLVARARGLRDRRLRRTRPFFAGTRGRYALAAAKRNTPRMASRWGYLMNMGLDSFASAFSKHTAA